MLQPVLPGEEETARSVAALGEDLRAAGVEVVDLRPRWLELEAAGEISHYPDDGHWTVLGHRAFAEVLHAYLAATAAD